MPPLPYASYGVDRARRLRREMTFPERLLWSRLRRDQLGVTFRRQQPIGPYIADFYAPCIGLIIEVDGRSHDGREQEDAEREDALCAAGLRIVRVTNDQVLQQLDGVVALIAAALWPEPDIASPHMDATSGSQPE